MFVTQTFLMHNYFMSKIKTVFNPCPPKIRKNLTTFHLELKLAFLTTHSSTGLGFVVDSYGKPPAVILDG